MLPLDPPGEMLLEEFIKPLGITQAQLADRIGVSYVRLNEIVNGRIRRRSLLMEKKFRPGPASMIGR